MTGLAVVPAQAGDSVALRVSQARIQAGAASPGTRIRLVSPGARLDGRVVVRRVGAHRVAAWPVAGKRRTTLVWDATNRAGKPVRPGLYRVRALVHPQGRPAQLTRISRTVRVVARPKAHQTRFGYVVETKVRRAVDRFHLEVHQRTNQLLVVNHRNRVVRQIPVGGNPAISKPRLSYVADRTPMSYDYAWTKRLPWFVRLVQGRGIGSHTIPRYISTGRPTIPVSALGRRPGVHAPVSAGCLRMHDRNARWVYHNVPAGTPVYWL